MVDPNLPQGRLGPMQQGEILGRIRVAAEVGREGYLGGTGTPDVHVVHIHNPGQGLQQLPHLQDLDVFGNNSCWLLPRSGAAAGQALCFAIGPMDCELCGSCFDSSGRTLFLAVQHPGELHGTRQGDASEWQAHQLVDRDSQPFEQLRQVPLGSNWPSGAPGRPPRPGGVAIRRLDNQPLLATAG